MSDSQQSIHAIDRVLSFSKFNSAKGVLRSDPKSRTWSKWAKLLTTHRTTSQKDTVNYVFGFIPEGETRKDIHVEYFDAMALDVDCVSDSTLEAVVDSLSQFEFILYTSFNHKSPTLDDSANNKVRIVLPFAERLPASEYKRVQSQFDTMIGGENDKGVRKISQP